MTTEEKARAYDEALEKAKKELGIYGSLDCYAARQIFRFFPQLAESEDEKVRKEIIEVLQFVPSSMWEQAKTDYERCFAYLEKQKENTWSEEDDAKVKVMCEEGDLKPSERAWLKDLKNRVWKEQKPEWSEEDNKNLGEILGVVYEASCGIYRPFERDTYKRWESWLKSLRPSWKPSEEQIHAIVEALKYLPNNKDEWMVLNTLADVLRKLM